MQTYSVIYLHDEAYLRQDNPLKGAQHLISREAYHEHEIQYVNSALPFINPVPSKINYTAEELHVIWQIKDNVSGTWISADGEFLTGESRQVIEAINQSPTRLSFQNRVKPWILNCFGEDDLNDIEERRERFAEEALELVQSLGMTEQQLLKVLKYTFSRPPGEPAQEVGGVMVTLAGLCLCANLDIEDNAETELKRVWENIEPIRQKQQIRKNQIHHENT